MLAVLGAQDEARGGGLRRSVAAQRRAADFDVARQRGIDSEQRPQQLRAAGAEQPGDADDLARPQLQRHLSLRERGRAQPAHRQHDLPRGVRIAPSARQLAADHQPDDRVVAGARPRQFAAVLAVAQTDDAIGDRLHFPEPVRDVDDADAGRLQLAHHREQPLRLDLGQARRRLVHDQHARLGAQRTRDLEQLPLPGTQRPDRRVRRHVETEPRRPLPRLRRHGAPLQERPAAQFGAEEQGAGDIEVVAQAQLLVDQRDAGAQRRGGRIQFDRDAIEAHGADLRPVHAGQHLHQRALARPVLADQRHHFAALQREVDAAQRAHTRERLLDPTHLQQRRHRVHFLPVFALRSAVNAATSALRICRAGMSRKRPFGSSASRFFASGSRTSFASSSSDLRA